MMIDTTKQLMQLIHDMGVVSERMDQKNSEIELLQATVAEKDKRIDELEVENRRLADAIDMYTDDIEPKPLEPFIQSLSQRSKKQTIYGFKGDDHD